jgi:DNA modification methylase
MQLGLEPTPEEYVAHMVEVFREVRRVLRDDGVLWLNLGDSYAAGKLGRDDSGDNGRFGGPRIEPKQRSAPPGLKPKDLVGIPWRVAFALQADGWWLRADCIWAKPNPMPESVTDRPTKSHEYLFLLAKSERYYYDQDAVREPHSRLWDESNGGSIATGRMAAANGAMGDMSTHPKGYPLPNPTGRNRRSVWTIATKPYSGAHFATFPEKLVEPCILAGCPAGGTVLDPFGGAGTTGLVAVKHGRNAILIELNPAYGELIRDRIGDTQLLMPLEVPA